MLTALVLVCSLAITPDLAACNRENAIYLLQVPEHFNSPVACMMHGQAYIAGTSIGQDMMKDAQIKVICSRG